jgi:hypothetical protein
MILLSIVGMSRLSRTFNRANVADVIQRDAAR